MSFLYDDCLLDYPILKISVTPPLYVTYRGSFCALPLDIKYDFAPISFPPQNIYF